MAFWLIVAALIGIALLIILPPLFRKQNGILVDDPDQRNIKIAQDRLKELKANRDAGGISQEHYEEQLTELELVLSDDLDVINTSTPQDLKQGYWLAYVILLLVPIASISLYWTLGRYDTIGLSKTEAPAGQADVGLPNAEQINQMVGKLAEKMKTDPNNIEGWLMLGRSYKALQKYPEAVEALAHAYQLASDKAEVLLPYAEVLALANNNTWAGLADELLTKALSIEPENPAGLWFAAMSKAQQGNKNASIGYLQKLKEVLPPDSPDRKQIESILANVEGGVAEPPSEQDIKQGNPVSVAISVNLALGFKTEVKPDETLFIYAQALTGPKMPLAIIRKQVADLPLTVTLSDADSMMPNMKLSNFKEVRLLARISKTGNAMPQTGDLIGVVEQVNLAGQAKYEIVINDHVK